MRLFIAIEFPEEIKAALKSGAESLRPYFQRARFTGKENYHLTMVFLGEVEPKRLPDIKAAMDACVSTPIDIRITRLGRFKGGRGDTLWRKIEAGRELWDLQSVLEKELRQRGFEIESRPFKPHLTVAREAVLQSGTLEELSGTLPALSHTAGGMSLMLSERKEGKLVYTPLYIRQFC